MNKRNFTLAAGLSLALATGSIAALGAQQGHEDQPDIQALSNAKISLIEAIQAAEKATTARL